MKSRCKKLITDINRGSELNSKLSEYAGLLNSQYNLYATVKMCMNYYTMKETIYEQQDKSGDYVKYFEKVTDLITKHVLKRENVGEESLACISDIRNKIEYKMKILTSFADGYEIYEYILNRVEARVTGNIEDVAIDLLSTKLFNYVFSEDDTVLVNSKLQLIMSQLPVRMTKMKFFDVVARTVAIYNGSERNSVDEFADMLRTAVLAKKPEGFETEYPFLYEVYNDLSAASYKEIDKGEYDRLTENLEKAANLINDEVSAYMLLQEIVNDVYSILLSVDDAYDMNASDAGYKSALAILEDCAESDDVEEIPARLMTKFINIEGVQETVYENIMILEAAYEDVFTPNKSLIEELGISEKFAACNKIEKLLSTSLFIDLNKDEEIASIIADSDYINKVKEELISEFSLLFKDKDKIIVRSMMCKLLSSMPIFLNSQQEIKDYFDYVLNNCKDDSELTACSKLLCDIMEEK